MPKYAIVEEACKYCWGKNFMGAFQEFFDEHAHVFREATGAQEEQNLEYYELFQRYLRIYEANLSSYVDSLDCTVEEFYGQLAEILNDPEIKDKKLLHFVNYLLACTDYPSFLKIMVRQAKTLIKAEAKEAAVATAAAGGSKVEGSASGGSEVKSPAPRRVEADSKGEGKEAESKDSK